ncbi:MAG: helix-turn-helix transcriptional regulator [Clostridium sp.]|nr:helix-turn-helix transcriptional regulator [Clostridium sp.]
MIRYDRLWSTMEAKGLTQYRLIKQHNFSAGQIGRLKKNMHVSTHTLDTLCSILDCSISDIVEYSPEGSLRPEQGNIPEQEPLQVSEPEEAPVKQKKAESSKGDKAKKTGKSKKSDKKAAKDGKKGKDSKKNK